MKEIEAAIRPYRLGAALGVLHTHPKLPGCAVGLGRGFPRQMRRFGHPVGAEPAVDVHADLSSMEHALPATPL